MDFLRAHETASLSDLSLCLNVSEMTVRRDLKLMADQGLLVATRGGAVRLDARTYELSFIEKRSLCQLEKQLIAQEAVRMTSNDHCLFLDSGTTTGEVARLMGADDGVQRVVITGALNVINILHPCRWIELLVIGGAFRETSLACMGSLAEEMLESLSADVAIIGAEGLDPDIGVSVHDLADAHLKKRMIQRSRRVVLVADHTKIGASHMAVVCAVSEIDVLITGKEADPAFVEAVRSRGMEVRQVG